MCIFYRIQVPSHEAVVIISQKHGGRDTCFRLDTSTPISTSTISSFSAARHIRRHTFSLRVAPAFVLPNHLCFIPQSLSALTHAGFVDGMASGNLVPSFPSSVVTLEFNEIPRMFTLLSVYSGTCRARPITEQLFTLNSCNIRSYRSIHWIYK